MVETEISPTSDSEGISGGCLCGDVRFTLNGDVRPVVYCHCEQCRRTSGHFVAATRIADDALHLLNTAGLRWFESSLVAKRGFCHRCGSSLFWKHNDSDHTSVMAGSIDDKQALVADRHIFTADKAGYYGLDDGLPCHEQAD